METVEWEGWARRMPRWLRGLLEPARDDGFFGPESGFIWFGTAIWRGVIVLMPVVLLTSILFAVGSGAPMLGIMIAVLFSYFGYLIALLPAVTAAVLYLPAVWWAARRWPRAGRAAALACLPLMLLGMLPFWEMWRMLEMWQMRVPVAAGLLVWAATLPLPSPLPEVE